MILYCDPLATSCRPLLDLAGELRLPLDVRRVGLQRGEHLAPAFLAVNPNGQVPVLVDQGFTLTESGAILQYLAAGSRFDLQDPRAAARQAEALDWFKTGFATDFCQGYAYPKLVRALAHPDSAVQADLTERAAERARRRFEVLNHHWLGDGRPYLTGPAIGLADLVGAPMVDLATPAGFDLRAYPKVTAWLARMRARPTWVSADAAFAQAAT